jgi:hypothetical protein
MATRRQLREAFYDELETAASGHVPSEDVRQDYPNDSEELPAIVHRDDYRKVPINRGAAPVDKGRDSNDDVTGLVYASIIEAQFSLLVVSDDEQEKEDAYEAVRSHFEEFTHPIRDASEIHSDAHRVEVQDAVSEDTEERDPPARGDRLAINVRFQRFYTSSETAVDYIGQNIDADDDGIDDINRNTTTSN